MKTTILILSSIILIVLMTLIDREEYHTLPQSKHSFDGITELAQK